MLNKNNERELSYIVRVDDILPITGSDNCECAMIGGWTVMVRKETFKKNDLAIYFEIDSKVDTNKPEFAFLEKKHGAVKTQKYTFGGKGCFYSMGLLMRPSDFGWNVSGDSIEYIENGKVKTLHCGDFVTELLGVTYYVPEDNKRKSNRDKYDSMKDRHKKLFKKFPFKQLMKYTWGRKFLYLFFGKKKDKKKDWPEWVKKTDEERVQNMPFLFPDNKDVWMVTEKIDGTSTTFTMLNDRKKELIVCSRNVVFNKPDKKCFYETNVYTEMAEKYNMESVMKTVLEKINSGFPLFVEKYGSNIKFLTIQGETFGGSIQKRNYGDEHRLAIFNVIFGYKDGSTRRLNPKEMSDFIYYVNNMTGEELKTVPIIDTEYHLPDSCEKMLEYAHGESKIDGELREGVVLRTTDGVRSFKAVDPEFLVRYHG